MRIKFDGTSLPLKQILWLDNQDQMNSYAWLRIALADDLASIHSLTFSMFKECMESLQAVPCFSDQIGTAREEGFGWAKGFYVLAKVCSFAEMNEGFPLQAAAKKVAACLQEWRSRGFNLNAPLAHQQCYPLHLAARSGSVALCTALLELEVDKNAYRSQRNHKTALHIAAKNGNAQIVETLLSYGAAVDVGMGDPVLRGNTPLIAGIQNKEVVELLLRYGAERDAQSEDLIFGPTALEKAARLGQYDVIQAFAPVSLADFARAYRKTFDRVVEVCSVKVTQQHSIDYWRHMVEEVFACLLTLDQLQRAAGEGRCAEGSLTPPIDPHLTGELSEEQVESLCRVASYIIDEARSVSLPGNQDIVRKMEGIYCFLLNMGIIMKPASPVIPEPVPPPAFHPDSVFENMSY